MATNNKEDSRVFFTNKDDPRDCIIIGWTYPPEGVDKPIFFRFTTENVSITETQTTVTRNDKDIVAILHWSVQDQLGDVTVGTKNEPMSWFVMRGSIPNTRLFRSGQGIIYEWRKSADTWDSYDLYDTSSPTPDVPMARFRREAQDTPVGRSHAVMTYNFDLDDLLLDALIALCLNRWLERRR